MVIAASTGVVATLLGLLLVFKFNDRRDEYATKGSSGHSERAKGVTTGAKESNLDLVAEEDEEECARIARKYSCPVKAFERLKGGSLDHATLARDFDILVNGHIKRRQLAGQGESFQAAHERCVKSPDPQPNIWHSAFLLPGLHTYEAALNKIPKGYRLPYAGEFEQLLADTEYSFKDGFGLFKFNDGFELQLPAEGCYDYHEGCFRDTASHGYYWSGKAGRAHADSLLFGRAYMDPSYSSWRSDHHSVIYVKDLKMEKS